MPKVTQLNSLKSQDLSALASQLPVKYLMRESLMKSIFKESIKRSMLWKWDLSTAIKERKTLYWWLETTRSIYYTFSFPSGSCMAPVLSTLLKIKLPRQKPYDFEVRLNLEYFLLVMIIYRNFIPIYKIWNRTAIPNNHVHRQQSAIIYNWSLPFISTTVNQQTTSQRCLYGSLFLLYLHFPPNPNPICF